MDQISTDDDINRLEHESFDVKDPATDIQLLRSKLGNPPLAFTFGSFPPNFLLNLETDSLPLLGETVEGKSSVSDKLYAHRDRQCDDSVNDVITAQDEDIGPSRSLKMFPTTYESDVKDPRTDIQLLQSKFGKHIERTPLAFTFGSFGLPPNLLLDLETASLPPVGEALEENVSMNDTLYAHCDIQCDGNEVETAPNIICYNHLPPKKRHDLGTSDTCRSFERLNVDAYIADNHVVTCSGDDCPLAVHRKFAELDCEDPANSYCPSRTMSVSDLPKRVLWTVEEENMLKVGVETFSTKIKKNMPWRKILEMGKGVFHKTRTSSDLKDKWRRMMHL